MNKQASKVRLQPFKSPSLRSYDQRKISLLFDLRRRLLEHKNCPDPIVPVLYEDTIGALEENQIAIPKYSKREHIFGKISLLSYIQKLWSECVDRLFYEGSIWRLELLSFGGTVPPSKMLFSTDGVRFLETKLYAMVQNVREYPVQNAEEEQRLLNEAEVLRAISDFLLAIKNFLPDTSLKWCEVCFRRTPSSRRYCREHKSASTGELNTVHSRAKRQRAMLSEEAEAFWQQYKACRNRFESGAKIVCRVEDLLDAQEKGAIIVQEQVREFIDASLNLPWSSMSVEWEKLIQSTVNLRHHLVNKASDFDTWGAFVEYVMFVLKEKLEKNRHPYLILFLILTADDYLSNQQQSTDRRCSDSKQQILNLCNDLGMSARDVARQLDLSVGYVYRVLRSHRQQST